MLHSVLSTSSSILRLLSHAVRGWSLIAVRVGALAVAFYLGRAGADQMWLAVAIAIWLYAERTSFQHDSVWQAMIAKQELSEPFHIRQMLSLLPPWVFDETTPGSTAGLPGWLSDQRRCMDKAEWVNVVLKQMWPNIHRAAKKSFQRLLAPLLNRLQPDFFPFFSFTIDSLGHDPPVITGVYRDHALRHACFDLDVAFVGDCDMTFRIWAPVVKISKLGIHGRLRVTFDELVDDWPCVSAISVSFLDIPKLTFSLDALAVNVMILPGVSNWLTSLCNDQVARKMVWPNKLTVRLRKEHQGHAVSQCLCGGDHTIST